MVDFGRWVTSDREAVTGKEWLVTNGIGGYASGTIAGVLTRRYHGLLVAALRPPLGRTLLLAKVDETAVYNRQAFDLFTNRWSEKEIVPHGYQHLERFHLEGTTPVWTFALGDALLEKRVWMQRGANTTYIHYTLRRAQRSIDLSIKAFVNYRDYHGCTRGEDLPLMVQEMGERGIRVQSGADNPPFHVLLSDGRVVTQHIWYKNFYLAEEVYRGFRLPEDHLLAGVFRVTLPPGQSVTLVASMDESPSLDGETAYRDQRAYENGLITQSQMDSTTPQIQQLVLAADQFIVKRNTEKAGEGTSIIAGYHWFGDWGRDTMISLPGLTLNTRRFTEAANILRTFAGYTNMGMLPNRFPDSGGRPDYNTVDATLWYFEAVRAYFDATNDETLIRELFPTLVDIIAWHLRGTRYEIHADSADGLLYAGEEGTQLTWMDAKVDNWVVTPRIGKPVEVNALWYNALMIMADFAERLTLTEGTDYNDLAVRVKNNFARFWNDKVGYCYDVIDTPDGNPDARLRPNQLFAVALPHSPLEAEQQKLVVDTCAQHLLTSHGLRSLSPYDPDYTGLYGGDYFQRDSAYHQGTVWAWLIAPFIAAHLRVYGDKALARSFLQPLLHHLDTHGVGTVGEIFDGDPPFAPRGAIAQAWSVAEVLHAWCLTI